MSLDVVHATEEVKRVCIIPSLLISDDYRLRLVFNAEISVFYQRLKYSIGIVLSTIQLIQEL